MTTKTETIERTAEDTLRFQRDMALLQCGQNIAMLDKLRISNDELLAALRDIETRSGYCLIRPDKTNNDIQMDYIHQQARSAIARAEKGKDGDHDLAAESMREQAENAFSQD